MNGDDPYSTDEEQAKSKLKRPILKEKRPISDKQKENLKMGMEALKQKRLALAQEKEDRKKTNEELISKGLPPIEPPPKIKPAPPPEVIQEPVEIKIKSRKERSDKGKTRTRGEPAVKITRAEIDELKALLTQKVEIPVVKEVPREVIREVIREVPVPVVAPPTPVVKQQVLTGSALLQKIFFDK